MLKKLFISLLFVPAFSFAQNFRSTLIFSAEQGDAFFVYLNGQKQNAAAQANVTIHGLELPYYDVRIEFLNSAIKPIEKKNVVAADSDDRPMQVTYKVRKDKSGKARISFYAMLPPVATSANPAPLIQELKREPVVAAVDSPVQKTILTNVSGATVSLGDKAVKAKVDSATAPKPAQEIRKDPDVAEKPAKKNDVVDRAANKSITAKKDVKSPEKPVKEETSVLPPLKKCNDWPLMKEEFQKIRQQAAEVKDEQRRLAKAKSLSESNCLLVSQVAELASLFTTDAGKLDFLKHAYSATIDRPNYERLRKLFTDAGSIRNFDKFLQSRK